MSLITTKGLIIKEQKVGEADRLVTVLTEDLGLIRAFAPGALKIKSRNISATSLLSYSELNIYQSRDTYKINSASSIEIFFGLRNDISALALAGYFCELLMNLAPEYENADNYLRLTLNCLHLLCENKRSQEIIKAIFEMKILEFSGYCPDFSRCTICKTKKIDSVGFDILNGVICCDKCKSERFISIPNSVFASLCHIIYQDEKKMFSFKINSDSEKILADITERYLLAQTEKTYNTLDFYKQMRM